MVRLIILAVATLPVLPAYDFGFNVLVRAGVAGAGDWEVGLGLNSSGVPSVSGHLNPYFSNGTDPHRFEIGYDASTTQAFARFYESPTATTPILNLRYNVPGAFALSSTGFWTLPAASFYVQATGGRPVSSGVTADNMSLATAAGVLNPPSLSATQTGPTVRNTQASNIVFTPNSGGSWMLSGNVLMTGLSAYNGSGGADRSRLQFGFTAEASNTATPEPGTLVLMASALGFVIFKASRPRRNA